MINFKDVVLSYLVEQGETPSPADSSEKPKTEEDKKADKEAEDTKSVVEFLKQNTSALQTIWNQHYKNYNQYDDQYKEPNEAVVTLILNRVAQTSRQKMLVKDVKDYIQPLFPLLDLIIYLRHPLYKDKALTNEKKLENWKQRLPKPTGSQMPIKFNPMTAIAAELRKEYLMAEAYTDLGANFLASNPDKSIWFVIMKMLEVRKKNRGREIDLKKVPSTVNWVNNLLYYPEKYAGGGNKVNANLRAVYEEVTAEKLLGLAFAVKNLFQSEAMRAGGATNLDQLKSKPLYEKALIGFYNNQPLLNNQFAWESFKLNESRIFAFSDAYKQMLNEYNPNALPQAYRNVPIENKTDQQTDDETPKTEEPLEDTKIDLTGGYTISNILKMSKNAEFGEAAAVYKLLQNFADHVREEEPKDLVGKLQRTAAGLKSVESALGIKM